MTWMSMSAEQPAQGASRLLLLALTACAAALPGSAMADDELPDMALLEYLGSWEETDEDWVLFDQEDEHAADAELEGDPVAEGDESQEWDDER
jgi:hypothetical protein